MGKLVNTLRSSKYPLLQVALDFLRVKEAVKLVRELSELSIDIYEVGTPLIKSEGIDAVRILKLVIPPSSLLLADMKTADTGSLEVRMAYEGGADVSTVLATAANEVIKSALGEGRKLGVDIIVDTIGIKGDEVLSRVGKLVDMGVEIVNIHTAIDVQRALGERVVRSAELIRKLVREYPNLFISVSGGIRPQDVGTLLESGASIIVVGSYITKSPDPRKSTMETLEAMGRKVVTK